MHNITPLFVYFQYHTHAQARTYLSVNNRVTHLNGEAITGIDYRSACHVTLHNIITSVVLSRVTCFYVTCWEQELLLYLSKYKLNILSNINFI
jgi:hypothetical protein